VVQRADERLAVIGAEVDLAAAEQELANRPDRHAILKKKIAAVRGEYDFILLDCPPSLGLLTVNALAAADEVIVPMQAHFLALQGMSKLLETVQLVRQGMNTQLRVSGVVLAMHEAHTNLAGEVVADLENFFAASRRMAMPWSNAVIYQPAIRRNIKLAECPSFGQTIFQYAPASAGAADYAQLAAAVMGKNVGRGTSDVGSENAELGTRSAELQTPDAGPQPETRNPQPETPAQPEVPAEPA
jgi:chromosome partitioning protein